MIITHLVYVKKVSRKLSASARIAPCMSFNKKKSRKNAFPPHISVTAWYVHKIKCGFYFIKCFVKNFEDCLEWQTIVFQRITITTHNGQLIQV